MRFDIKNVKTAVEAGNCIKGMYGYFANDIASIRQTVENKKTSMKTFYAKLDGICEDKFERRFSCQCGTFSLFYPLDLTERNERY